MPAETVPGTWTTLKDLTADGGRNLGSSCARLDRCLLLFLN